MTVRVGINGMGRIGNLSLRASIENKQSGVEVVSVNSITSVENLRYKLLYDSVHGPFRGTIEVEGEDIVVNGRKIKVFQEKDPRKIAWGKVGVDCVLECSGQFLTTELAKAHLEGGAKKVVLSAPAKDDTPTFVMGVNEKMYRPELRIISNASCTTNCLAPIAKILEERFGIDKGFMATVHAATSSQNVLDGASKKKSRDGRAAMGNVIPTTTGATKSVERVIPSLKSKLTGISYRVPTMNVSMVDFTVILQKSTTLEAVNAAIVSAAEGEMKGILTYTKEELVSSDFNHNPHSCTYDLSSSMALGDRFFKLIAWYDNEWGYSNRMVDMSRYVCEQE